MACSKAQILLIFVCGHVLLFISSSDYLEAWKIIHVIFLLAPTFFLLAILLFLKTTQGTKGSRGEVLGPFLLLDLIKI